MPVYQARRAFAVLPSAQSPGPAVSMEEGQMVDLDSGDVFPEFERLLRDGYLVPVPALDSLDRDTSPLPTDFEDIRSLLQDMEQWAREHQEATFLCTDDPGYGIRVPRFGWTGFYLEDDPGMARFIERSKQWTISIPNMKRTCGSLPVYIEGYLKTAQGRQDLLQRLVEAARSLPEIECKTIWERLLDDAV